MSAEDKRPQPDHSQELDRLVGAANMAKDTDSVRPSSDTIRAYLLGIANRSQKDEIRDALLVSSAFRREMQLLTEELNRVESPPVQQGLNTQSSENVPDLSSYVTGSRAVAPRSLGVWSRIRKIRALRNAPRWAAALAIVVLAIASFSLLRSDKLLTGALVVVQEQVDIDALISLSPRDLSTRQGSQAYETAELAALAGFRSALKFEDGAFAVDSNWIANQGRSTSGEVLLRMRSADGNTRDLTTDFSTSVHEAAPEMSAWILFLPQRKLCSVKLSSSKMEVHLGNPNDDHGLLIVVWRDKGLFRASSVRSF